MKEVFIVRESARSKWYFGIFKLGCAEYFLFPRSRAHRMSKRQALTVIEIHGGILEKA